MKSFLDFTLYDSVDSVDSVTAKLIVSDQAVCVTTHNLGSWVKLLTVPHFNRGTVEREMNQTQGSKHCFLF